MNAKLLTRDHKEATKPGVLAADVSDYVWKIGMPHPTTDPRYWRSLATTERWCAASDRRRKFGTVESIRLHEEAAKRYDAEASRLEALAGGAA